MSNHPLSTEGWTKYSVGRADLLLPPNAKVEYLKTKVNDIEIKRVYLKPGQTFAQAWAERLQAIETGHGGPDWKTKVERRYPSSPTEQTVLVADDDTGLLHPIKTDPTLEHWGVFGDKVYVGEVVSSLADLPLAEQFMRDVFTHISTEHPPTSKDDFAIDGAVVHVASAGGEATSFEAQISILTRAKPEGLILRISLDNQVLITSGNMTTIARSKATETASHALNIDIKIPRRGNRTISGLPGEETVEIFSNKGKQEVGGSSFRGEWETRGIASNASAPESGFRADVEAMYDADPSLLLAYWDAIASSLKYR